MYLQLSLYLNEVLTTFSSHKQSNINRSTKIETHFLQNKKSWNNVKCSQKLILQIAGAIIRLGAWDSVVIKALRY
jgi:hypothetical protein